MENETKIPKKRWPDRTQTQRTARRREKLNVIARTRGFDTWAKLETAVLNGAILVVVDARNFNETNYFSQDDLAVIVPIPEAR